MRDSARDGGAPHDGVAVGSARRRHADAAGCDRRPSASTTPRRTCGSSALSALGQLGDRRWREPRQRVERVGAPRRIAQRLDQRLDGARR